MILLGKNTVFVIDFERLIGRGDAEGLVSRPRNLNDVVTIGERILEDKTIGRAKMMNVILVKRLDSLLYKVEEVIAFKSWLHLLPLFVIDRDICRRVRQFLGAAFNFS